MRHHYQGLCVTSDDQNVRGVKVGSVTTVHGDLLMLVAELDIEAPLPGVMCDLG